MVQSEPDSLPDVILTSARLSIRPFRIEDAQALADYRSDPEVARYQGWSTPFPVEAAARMIAELTGPAEPGWFQHAVDLAGTLIGDIGVNTHENLMQADLGYTLAPAYQGRGYATEAVGRVVEHLFADRGLHRVSAECDARNERSAKLLTRLGFRQEGHRVQHSWIKGEWTDDLLFGLLAKDFRTPVPAP